MSDAHGGASSADQALTLLHGFNQPLTAIGNYAQAGCHLIDQKSAELPQLRDLFAKIARQSARASALSQELAKSLKVE